MKKLLVHMRAYWREAVLGPLFKLLEAIFELLAPLVLARLIDRGIGGGDRGYVLQMCLLLAVLGAVGLASSFTAQYFAAKAAVGFATRIRTLLFQRIQSLSYADIDTLGTSSIVTRLTSDTNQIQSGVNLTLRLLLRSPFVVFGAALTAFTIDPRISVIFLAVIAALGVTVALITLVTTPLYRRIQSRLEEVLGLIRENLSGTRVIRAFRLESRETAEFDRRNTALTNLGLHTGRIAALMNPATFILVNLAVIALIYAGGVQVDGGCLTQGQVVALYNLMAQILVELLKLASLIVTMTRSVASGRRVQELLEQQSTQTWPATPPKEIPGSPAVEYKNVSLRYGGDEALTNINFSARRGETIGIVGGTGSGKTSLIQLIGRFYDASSGEVLVNGINVRDYPRETLRAKIGMVPQKAMLIRGSLRENLCWGKANATDEELYAALDAAQASDIIKAKGGLDFVIEEGGKNLSGGQRQRLTIARALVRKPEILILDDSASALDYATDAALRQSLRAIGNTTVFIVSQRASSVRHADKIIVLEDGAVVGFGTGEELLSTCEVYREIYESQFQETEGQAHA